MLTDFEYFFINLLKCISKYGIIAVLILINVKEWRYGDI